MDKILGYNRKIYNLHQIWSTHPDDQFDPLFNLFMVGIVREINARLGKGDWDSYHVMEGKIGQFTRLFANATVLVTDAASSDEVFKEGRITNKVRWGGVRVGSL